MKTKIGNFSARIIELLELDIPVGTPIYIADSNIEHMKSSHPEDYKKYGTELNVRVSTRNIYYARSLYVLNPNRVKNFIAKGTLKKLDN